MDSLQEAVLAKRLLIVAVPSCCLLVSPGRCGEPVPHRLMVGTRRRLCISVQDRLGLFPGEIDRRPRLEVYYAL